MTRIEVKRSSQKIERSGAFGDYEVSGWRYVDDVTWQVKVWLAGSPRDWFGYTMTSGQQMRSAHSQRSPTFSPLASDCQLGSLMSGMATASSFVTAIRRSTH